MSKEMENNSLGLNNKNNKTENNIFPSAISSRNSVHFVPGNRFWIERKIQNRNRRQDEQKRINHENEQYFM